MDSSFTIRSPAGARAAYGRRDPVRVREVVETDLDAARAVTAPGHEPNKQHDPRRDHPGQPPQDHSPRDVVADPKSREVIYRERDVRSGGGQHPDQALRRQRAYLPAAVDTPASPDDPHADIKA